MSKYTTEVRFICETAAGYSESQGYNNIESILSASAPKIFNFDFPIFDENYRLALEKKILRHFYVREIGFETVGLWKYWLNVKLNEIMPYYNQLYESALLEFNPLYDVDMTTDHWSKGNTTGKDTSDYTRTDNLDETLTQDGTVTDEGSIEDDGTITDDGNNGYDLDTTNRYSDTPQGGIVGLVEDNYLTRAEVNHNHNEGSDFNERTLDTVRTTENTRTYDTQFKTENRGTQRNAGTLDKTLDTTEKYIDHVVGKTPGASFAKMLTEYRDTFLNIDLMVINELEPLFFGLW